MPHSGTDAHGRIVPFDRHIEHATPSGSQAAPTVTALGRTITIIGELYAEEHVIINGQITGTVSLPRHGVAIGADGTVDGRIFARSVTILGTVTGSITAEARAELRDTARVEGRVVADRVGMEEGAYFKGTIDTSRADIASRVARYRADQKTGAPSS